MNEKSSGVAGRNDVSERWSIAVANVANLQREIPKVSLGFFATQFGFV